MCSRGVRWGGGGGERVCVLRDGRAVGGGDGAETVDSRPLARAVGVGVGLAVRGRRRDGVRGRVQVRQRGWWWCRGRGSSGDRWLGVVCLELEAAAGRGDEARACGARCRDGSERCAGRAVRGRGVRRRVGG